MHVPTKHCPGCREEFFAAATRCSDCGSELEVCDPGRCRVRHRPLDQPPLLTVLITTLAFVFGLATHPPVVLGVLDAAMQRFARPPAVAWIDLSFEECDTGLFVPRVRNIHGHLDIRVTMRFTGRTQSVLLTPNATHVWPCRDATPRPSKPLVETPSTEFEAEYSSAFGALPFAAQRVASADRFGPSARGPRRAPTAFWHTLAVGASRSVASSPVELAPGRWAAE